MLVNKNIKHKSLLDPFKTELLFGSHRSSLIATIAILLAIQVGFGQAWVSASFGEIKPLITMVLLILFSGLLISAISHLEWGIAGFIILSPLHLAFKEIFPSPLSDMWRDMTAIILLASWLTRQFLSRRSFHRYASLASVVLLLYIAWGAIAVLYSSNLMIGILGFRFQIRFIWLFFVILDTIRNSKVVKLYLHAILISSVIVGIIGLLQFIMVNFQIIEPGTSIDFTRSLIPSIRAYDLREGIYRSRSITNDPSHAGLIIMFGLMIPIAVRLYEQRGHHSLGGMSRWWMGIALIQALSLLTTLSRWTWFSALAGFLGIFAIVKHSHARLRVLAVVSFLSIVAISTAIISGYGPIVASWIGRMIYGTDTGYLSYHYELDLIKEVLSKRPFWGLGYNLPLEYFRRFNVDESLYLTDVGAGQGAFSYGEILIQTGLIGLSLYIGFWGILISNAMRITRHGNTDLARIVGALGVMALISGAFSGFHYGPLDVIGSDIYYYTLAAMIVAHSKRISPGQPEIVLPEAAHEIVKA